MFWGCLSYWGCDGAQSNVKTHEEYYPDGKLKETVELDQQGKSHGVQKAFWENGNVQSEYTWQHGVLDGIVKVYYENGKLSGIGHFSNGAQDSILTNYYGNGKVESLTTFVDGRNTGRFTGYFVDGGIKLLAVRRNDSTFSFIHYDSLTRKIDDFRLNPLSMGPDSLSSSAQTPFVITFDDLEMPSYFSLTRLSVYENNDAMVQRKSAYTIPGEVVADKMIFRLPKELKPAKWILDIIFMPTDSDGKQPSFGVSKTVHVIK